MIFEAEEDKVARHLASSNQNDVERKLDDSITLPYGDNLSDCWEVVAASRRGNAWVTHPWKSGKSRDTVDTPWPRLKSWLAGETESWKYNRPRAAFATDVTRARDRTRDSPESTYDALQPRVDGPVLIRAWIRYAPFFSPLEREFHFDTRGYFYV